MQHAPLLCTLPTHSVLSGRVVASDNCAPTTKGNVVVYFEIHTSKKQSECQNRASKIGTSETLLAKHCGPTGKPRFLLDT